MKRTFKIVFVFLSCCSFCISAQQLDVPRSSPKAAVSQHIGICKVSLTYSRPSVKSRSIFGKLVPFDKVWRAGANEATIIEFSHVVKIEGHTIPPGKYGLFILPTETDWTVIFNRVWDQWGAYHYQPDDDVARIQVRPEKVPHEEQLIYFFNRVTKNEGYLNIAWSDLKASIRMVTPTHRQTLAEIERAISEATQYWYVFSAAAQYHFYERKETDIALSYIDRAIALQAPNPAPWMLKSQILASQGKYEEAIVVAKEAISVSKKYDFYFEIEENEEKIAEWKSK